MGIDPLDQYGRQVEVEYQGDTYLVRDNGAVCRKSRLGHRKRRLDEVWTFGRSDDSSGYMHFGSHVVHRIVAVAFHERPSRQHIVDHIDTNRRNNRAENLRWVTRLENLLLNPITVKRIIIAYGSLDAFFKNPGATGEREPNFGWMRTVTKEEAEECRKRLLKWAESGQIPKGGKLGEWVYGARRPIAPILDVISDKQSLTPMAIQRNWKTLGEFPTCPDSIGSDPLGEYAARLKSGTVFYRNTFGATSTVVACQGDALLAVLGRLHEDAVKEWTVAKVTVENEKFVHESVSTYFSLEGALKAYCKLVDIDVPFEESVDDYS
jgi:HNH endonuclease